MPVHIHLFISRTPMVALTDVVPTFKSISVRELFKRFPKLKAFYNRSGTLWIKEYFVSSIGNVSEEIVRKYIQEQKINAKEGILLKTTIQNMKVRYFL
jgi:putative transposase